VISLQKIDGELTQLHKLSDDGVDRQSKHIEKAGKITTQTVEVLQAG